MSNRSPCKKLFGFSYTEVLIATALIGVSLVPLLDSLRHNLFFFSEVRNNNDLSYNLVASLEETRAKDFETLLNLASVANGHTTPTTLSDDVGTENRRLIYIGFYDIENADADSNPFTILDADSDADGNPFTGVAANIDMLWINVEIENTDYKLSSLSEPNIY